MAGPVECQTGFFDCAQYSTPVRRAGKAASVSNTIYLNCILTLVLRRPPVIDRTEMYVFILIVSCCIICHFSFLALF